MKQFLVFTVLSLLFFSCEKGVTFDLENSTPKLVVEATIEIGQPPYVVLTNSQNYFSQITPDIVASSFVRNANVSVSNGTVEHKLKEYSTPLQNGYIFYYYSIDSANLSTAFLGEMNKEYFLKINTGGADYTATTKIPVITRQIDSLFWKKPPGNIDSNKVALMIRATDKPGFGDYIRYYTKANSEPFYPALNSVFDDQIIDGTTYELEVERGVDRTKDIPENYSFFERGDTVTLKLCQIDKATFDFWRTMEFNYSSIGNPFGSPTKVLSNISNNALGYFGGYAPQFKTIIIPR